MVIHTELYNCNTIGALVGDDHQENIFAPGIRKYLKNKLNEKLSNVTVPVGVAKEV